MTPPPVARWIAENARVRGDSPAIISGDAAISYAALDARVAALAAGLHHELGIGCGDRIAVLAYNRPDYLALVFAAARLGAILVTLNWRLAPPEHAAILADADPRALVVDRELRDNAAALGPGLERFRRIGLGFGGSGWMSLDDLVAAGAGRAGPDASRDDAPLLLVYTSGTTGRAKGAILTQGAVAWNAANAIAAHDLVATDRVLTALPLFHVGGLNIQTLPALQVGATVLLHARFNPADALAAIARDRPSVVLLVPAVMKAMIAHPDWPRTDMSSLRLAMAGSSVVPVELIRAWHARGVPVGQVYGATETGPVSIVLMERDARRKEGSTGKSAPHCQARIVGADGRDVVPGERGEILLRGPHITSGYWGDDAATRDAFVDGWFRTGDIGHQDEDGDFWIDDRKQDMIISGGENIYPAELEAVLEEHPAIAEAAVVARADARWGEVPVAMVVRRAGAVLDAAQVKALFAGRLARFKHPHDVMFVDSLPRNVMGKVQRFALRAMLARG
jgi:fatty-acyl-CoA synthase